MGTFNTSTAQLHSFFILFIPTSAEKQLQDFPEKPHALRLLRSPFITIVHVTQLNVILSNLGAVYTT